MKSSCASGTHVSAVWFSAPPLSPDDDDDDDGNGNEVCADADDVDADVDADDAADDDDCARVESRVVAAPELEAITLVGIATIVT